MIIQLSDKVWFKKRFMIADHRTDFVSRDVFANVGLNPLVRATLVPPSEIDSDFMVLIIDVKNRDLRKFDEAMEKVERKLQFYRGYCKFVDSVKATLEPYRVNRGEINDSNT